MKELRIIELRTAKSAGVGDTKQPYRRPPVFNGEAAPESDPGEFVEAINELARQWAARRNFTTKKPVHRHLKVVSNRDHRDDTAAIAAGFDPSNCSSADSDDVGKVILG